MRAGGGYFVPVEGRARAGEMGGAGQADATAFRKLAEFFAPAGRFHHAANAFGKIHGAEAEEIGGDRVGRFRDAQTEVGGVGLEFFRDFIELYFLAGARLDGALAALGSARRLVGAGAAALATVTR